MNRLLVTPIVSLLSLMSVAQAKDVWGLVVSSVDEKPVPGVFISVQGSDRHTVTDIDGRFRMNDLPAKAILEFSYSGYQTVTYSPTGNANAEALVFIKPNIQDEIFGLDSDDFIFDEDQIADDEGMMQSVGTIQGATDDIFYQTANYNFSVLYYRMRGLESNWQTVYVNGIKDRKSVV